MSAVIDSNKLDRIARSKHAQIALDEGMKAGFKAYMAAPGHDREYDAYGVKPGFNRYCGEFGPYLEVLGLTATPAAPVLAERTDADIQAMIEAAVSAAVAEVLGTKAPKATRSSKRTSSAKPVVAKGVGRESKFTAKVVAALSLPTKKGATFTWKGKRGTSKWTVASSNKAGIVATRTA